MEQILKLITVSRFAQDNGLESTRARELGLIAG